MEPIAIIGALPISVLGKEWRTSVSVFSIFVLVMDFFAMLGQAFMDYRNEKGKRGQFTASIINRIFLWLDGRLADTDDMLGWMCIVEKL